MDMRTKLAVQTAVLCLTAGAAAAQQTGTTEPVQLAPIQIEADKINTSAQRAIVEKREAPNAITVIEAEQLNQFGDQPLGDAMRRLPGVSFPGGNRARDVQLRAIGVEYTQVLVNGRTLIDGNSKRSVQVDRIPSSMVERVEIIRSPLASQDGQGSAGTVNIVLKNQSFGERSEVGAGVGYLSDNGPLGDATFLQAMSQGPLSMVLSGGLQRQRRNESKDTFNYTGAGAANGGTLNENERRFDQINLTPSFQLQLSDSDILKLEPSYLRTRELRFDTDLTLTAPQTAINRTEVEKRTRWRENYGWYGEWTHQFESATDLIASLDYQQATEETFRNYVRYTAAGVADRTRQRTEDIDMERVAPALALRRQLGTHALEVGGNFSQTNRQEDNSDVLDGATQAPNRSRRYEIEERRWNGYVQDHFKLTPQDRIALGLRVEDSLTAATDFFGASTEQSNLFLLPSINYVHSFPTNTDFRAGVARTLRRPDLRELSPTVVTAGGTVASPDTGGNSGLTPESIWGLDVGVDQYFLDNRGLLAANTFLRRFDDKIENITALEGARYVARGQNVGQGQMIGLEVEGRLPLDMIGYRDLTLWANATRVKTEVEAKATGQTRRFLDQPDYVGNIGLDWFVPSLRTTFGASLNIASGYDQTYKLANGTSQSNDISSAKRVDLSARISLTDAVSLNLSALNIFADTEKRRDLTYNAAGALTAISTTDEPTYQTFYMRLSAAF